MARRGLVQRVWKLADDAAEAPQGVMDADDKLLRLLHKTIAAITGDIDKLQFNKAIARLYELVSAIERAPGLADPPRGDRHAAACCARRWCRTWPRKAGPGSASPA